MTHLVATDIKPTVVYEVSVRHLRALPHLASLLEYWNTQRGCRLAPKRGDLPVEQLHPWIGWLMIVEPIGSEDDFLYRLYGSEIARTYGTDMTGRRTSEFPGPIATFFLQVYRRVMAHPTPAFTEHAALPGIAVEGWHRLILPVSESGSTISQVVVASYPTGFRRRPGSLI